MTASCKYISAETLKGVVDVIVFGSDEIWNYRNVISGMDLTYFGLGDYLHRRIAYAPSFGDIAASEKLPVEMVKLAGFSHLSVRDKNSSSILKNYNLSAEVVSDPTMLSEKTLEVEAEAKENYILVYATYLNSGLVQEVKNFAAKNSLSIKCISYRIKGLKSDISVGPFEFEELFSLASYVVTNTLTWNPFFIKK